MKPHPFSRYLFAAVLGTAGAHAQNSGEPLIESVPPPPAQTETPPNFKAPAGARPVPGEGPPSTPAVDVTPPVIEPQAPGTFGPQDGQLRAGDKDDVFLIKDAALNDILDYLAKQAHRQYFHNSKIASQEYRVTGHLHEGNPLQQMEDLAFMYGLTLYTKGATVYALTPSQLAQLPAAEFQYQLKYLRPTDMDQIKELIKPVLSPSGVVNFEPKTNTVIIVDNAQKIEAARTLLEKVDRVKGQIVVETKILRINNSVGQHKGVDWSASLGGNGTKLELAQSLNSIFGIPSVFKDGDVTSTTGVSEHIGDTALVLSPVQLSGVLRALNTGNLAKQVSNPTLITEDNEQSTISIIDRVPIITSTSTQGNGISTNTEEVRYTIDKADSTDPAKSREIGISMVVKPTLLPDGTIRMEMRPRSAQIAEEIKGVSGNSYPRVTESMVQSIARIPDGSSLIIGGFYSESQTKADNKVPLLGDIPVINFFFKSKDATKEQTSLVFIVTPTSYDPRNRAASNARSAAIRCKTNLRPGFDWVDETNPGPAHEPNFRRAVRGLQPDEAPYYPDEDVVPPAPAPVPVPVTKYTPPATTSSSSNDSYRFSRARH